MLFVSVYLATFLALAFVSTLTRLFHPQWVASLAAIIATAVSIAFAERGHWSLGIVAPPATALRELAFGTLLAFVLIGIADVIILITTDVRHEPGSGFPFAEVLWIFVPAVIHEELLFRGYPFQKLLRWRRIPAIVISSGIFTLLHIRNHGITAVALLNIFLGGVLLALAYERRHRLLIPLALHFAWNLASGPILGYEVSGYIPAASLLVTEGTGHPLLTGGAFGIEGSVWMMVGEVAGIVWLARTNEEF
jgi:membrane protease YdiL (CAAX protease family)